MINTNLKCLITLPSSAILFFGGDALFFQSTLSLSILGKFNSFIFFFLLLFLFFLTCISEIIFLARGQTERKLRNLQMSP